MRVVHQNGPRDEIIEVFVDQHRILRFTPRCVGCLSENPAKHETPYKKLMFFRNFSLTLVNNEVVCLLLPCMFYLCKLLSEWWLRLSPGTMSWLNCFSSKRCRVLFFAAVRKSFGRHLIILIDRILWNFIFTMFHIIQHTQTPSFVVQKEEGKQNHTHPKLSPLDPKHIWLYNCLAV